MNLRQLKNYNIILAALLFGITIFSVFKYLLTLKEKYALLDDLSRTREQVLVLEQTVQKEKELQNALAKENSALKDGLKSSTEKLTQLEADLKNSQNTIEQITSHIALAKTENIALREEKDKMALELARVSQERDDLRVRLSSVPELKKTIREVKARMRKAKSMMKEITETRRVVVVEGNRGYLLKEGKSTFSGTKIKIEVMPASSSK